MMVTQQQVLDFWLNEIGPEGWFNGGEAVDRACRERFGAAWEAAHRGGLRDWLVTAEGTLAYLVLTDQLSRNIHRGHVLSFATDHLALSAAILGVMRDFDLAVDPKARFFFYLPFEHAESTQAQARCVCLMSARLEEEGKATLLLHARAHREIIRRFGRFPARNAALGRTSTAAEEKFLAEEGYGEVVRRLQG